MARLNTTVHVYDGFDVTVYLPGQEVAPQHLAQITAPGVWEVAPESLAEPKAPKQAKPATAKPVKATEPADLTPPPRGGKGSTVDAWRDYATKAIAAAGMKIDFPDDVKLAEIIDALTDAGIPVGE